MHMGRQVPDMIRCRLQKRGKDPTGPRLEQPRPGRTQLRKVRACQAAEGGKGGGEAGGTGTYCTSGTTNAATNQQIDTLTHGRTVNH